MGPSVGQGPLRLGTRASALARWQAEEVQRRLALLGHAAELVFVTTTGDRRTDVRLADIGGKGLFTQEIEAGLLEDRLDLAVHSLKDVPSVLPEGLELTAMLEREDPRDVLVAAPGTTVATLRPGARVGTASLRRQAQLLALRPDLEVAPVRGNVETRLRKWREGEFDAILLAGAGLKRLGLAHVIAERLDPEQFCPAGGQGIVAIECRAGDAETRGKLAALNHPAAAAAATAERALLARLDCGCQAPVGAFAEPDGHGGLRLRAMAATPDGRRQVRAEAAGALEQAAALGRSLAERLLRAGADEILRSIYA